MEPIKVKKFIPQHNFNRNHRKENHYQESFKLMTCWKGEILEIADLRIYGTNAANYACFWIHSAYKKGSKKHQQTEYASGSGSASGYGYHRPSAAVESAIRGAGVELDKYIGGVGDGAIKEALLAISRHLGYKKAVVIKSHP